MNLFGEAEVVFPGTFKKAPSPLRTYSIATNAIVSPTAIGDYQECAGSFGFPEDSGLENRFIIWRSLGPNIVFEEYSVDCDVAKSTLCLHIDNTSIVRGTSIYFTAGRLVIVVPTHVSAHRFFFKIYEHDSAASLVGKAVLSLFPSDDDLDFAHEEHVYTTPGYSRAVDVSMLPEDRTLIASQLPDGQVVGVVMHALGNPNERSTEKLLKTSGFFSRLIRTEEKWDAVSFTTTSEGLVYVLYSDFLIRVWKAENFQLLSTEELVSALADQTLDVRPVSIKANIISGRIVVTVNVKQAANSKFLFYASRENDELQLLASLSGPSSGEVIDFEMVDGFEGTATIWGIRRNSPRCADLYNLVRCSVDFKECVENWIEVQPVSSVEPTVPQDSLLRHRVDYAKRRIFGGEDFTVDVVIRSINMTCKGFNNITLAPHIHMTAVEKHVDEYLKSMSFKDHYAPRSDRVTFSQHIDREVVEIATSKFWTTLLQTCEQFQASGGFIPLRIWTAPQLELIGVIQQNRFTICVAADEEVESLLAPCWKKDDSATIRRIFSDTEKYRHTNPSQSDLIKLRGSIVGNIKRLRAIAMRFADHSPFSSNGVCPPSFEYGDSAFSAGFLGAVVRRYVMKRLEFASILRDIIRVTVESTSRTGGASACIKDREFTSRMNSMFTNYNILAQSLSARVILRTPLKAHGQRIPDDLPNRRQVCVAEAFFSLGGPTLLAAGTSVASSASGEEYDGEATDMDVGQDLDGEDVLSRQFDRRRQSSLAVHPFARFVADTSYKTIFYLWPESPELTLPRFLREHKFFAALQQYCIFNNSTLDCDLKFALRFYQAVAYAGTGLGEKAVVAFMDSLPGINRADPEDPLNKVFEASNKRHGVPHVSRATYFFEVLTILEEHSHVEQLLQLGKQALQEKELDDRVVQDTFTLVFKHQMQCGKYDDALETLQSNPVKSVQIKCLRDLLSKMVLLKRYEELLELNFGTLFATVVHFIELRAADYDVTKDSEIFDLLSSLYFKGLLYRRAAKTYYVLSNKLSLVPYSPENIARRCDALLKAVTLLSLTKENKWLDVEEIDEDDESMDISNANSSVSTQQKRGKTRVIHEEEIRREWFLETMKFEIMDPKARTSPPSDPEQVALKLIQKKSFDDALTLIGLFELEPYKLLEAVTVECIKINKVKKEIYPAWVYENMRYSYSEAVKGRHWQILQAYLRIVEEDVRGCSQPKRTIYYTLLAHMWDIPQWLEESYMEQNVEEMLTCLLEFGDFEPAFKMSHKFMDKISAMMRSGSKLLEVMSIALPVNAYDNLLHLTAEEEEYKEAREKLRARFHEVLNGIQRVEREHLNANREQATISKQCSIAVPSSPNSAYSPTLVTLRCEDPRSTSCMKPIPRRGAIKQAIQTTNWDKMVSSKSNSIISRKLSENGESYSVSMSTPSRKLSHQDSDSQEVSEN
ncbi:hypothetical protein QR680_005187 [Steinernema hermaphroditum]|uniref:Uncharacterized protein n=1 Tax=Steinernema hermaphroditum TaxID=289476 RepID=A0AA39HTC8_9BILA|nr:hypothetical protein QR680_005187 [Steinernema hermaphroditum]